MKSLVKEPNKELFVDWRPYLGHAWTARHDTRFDLKTLQELSSKMLEVPEGFVVQRQVSKIYEDRQKMAAGGLPINGASPRPWPTRPCCSKAIRYG